MKSFDLFVSRFYQGLGFYPGRANQILRTTVACIIVVILSQTLQIPDLALSLIVVFFVTQTNIVVTKLTGLFFIISIALAVATSLLILKITWDVPFLRILLASLVAFISLFMMRASKYGVIFYLVALIVIFSQSFVDVSSDSEEIIRNILWVWVAMSYAIAVTLIINALFLPSEPEKLLNKTVISQLKHIADLLTPDNELKRKENTLASIGQDLQSLYKLLQYTKSRDRLSSNDHTAQLAMVTMVSELRSLSCHLPVEIISQKSRETALRIKSVCEVMIASLKNHSEPLTPAAINTNAEDTTLREMAKVINNYDQNKKVSYNTPSSPKKKFSFFVPDAFSNKIYVTYALKTLLSALICYIFYTATDWFGIHTIMLTCLVVAQPGLGKTQRKITLRLLGAIAGSIAALIAIVFILPNLTTLFGLLLLSAPIFMLCSWVATGPENISYAGIQMLLTFSLAVLNGFTPVNDLTEVRDRIVGVILGIIIAGLIQTLIKPERNGEVLQLKLAGLMDLMKTSLSMKNAAKDKRGALMVSFKGCEDLATEIALEPTWMKAEGSHDGTCQKLQEILQQAKSMLISTDAVVLWCQQNAPVNPEIGCFIQQNVENLGVIVKRLKTGEKDDNMTLPDLPEGLSKEVSSMLTLLSDSIYSFWLLLHEI
ncbi:FUSC family protein [Obesumbacterium proteus]|uniref:FUSC family protein n=1 Tax=Obesumbacterium proteus TaxID=82983 RepID=UPI001F35782C|nr:FUSC family protein [Obesumbacterium proteus]MCE9886456.1 FUSC family protein [Obesumbacterium proteus]MCE9915486.1 FUSC family protein [Obesumbacterium proteus]MCE9929753.1 FUSC family protein [Obesumbacterium proteus]MCG2877128.1 FUSC family protein [Obesumbacterium proteus]